MLFHHILLILIRNPLVNANDFHYINILQITLQYQFFNILFIFIIYFFKYNFQVIFLYFVNDTIDHMIICRKNITLIILIFYLPILISSPVLGCKDILACGDSTGGDYNLLLKVRDPSRPGLQVLCIVPQDY